jgi:hypothetical protein
VTDLRAAYRENWGALITASAAAAASHFEDARALAGQGSDALRWPYPSGREDGYVFYALAHLCIAFGRQRSAAQRQRLADPLLAVAGVAASLLHASRPPEPPEPRFRPDLDG